MNKVLLLVLVYSAIVACSAPLPASTLSRDRELIQIAKNEINRRHIRLPSDCDIAVHEGVTVLPVQKPREQYIARFSFLFHGKRDVVYKVVINKQTRKVDDFIDYRHTVPGG